MLTPRTIRRDGCLTSCGFCGFVIMQVGMRACCENGVTEDEGRMLQAADILTSARKYIAAQTNYQRNLAALNLILDAHLSVLDEVRTSLLFRIPAGVC